MQAIRQKLPEEALQDTVVLDVEEHQSTYNYLSERSTRLQAGVFGASEAFVLGIAIYDVLGVHVMGAVLGETDVTGADVWRAVNNRALVLFFAVGVAGVLMGLAISECKAEFATLGCNAEKVYKEKKIQMLARLPAQNSLEARAAKREKSALTKLGALYFEYASTRNDFVHIAPHVHECGYFMGFTIAMVAHYGGHVATSHLVEWPLLLPVMAVFVSLGTQGTYEGGWKVLIAALCVAIVASMVSLVTYMLR